MRQEFEDNNYTPNKTLLVYLSCLPSGVQEFELKRFFDVFGHVRSINIARLPDFPFKCKGYGILECSSEPMMASILRQETFVFKTSFIKAGRFFTDKQAETVMEKTKRRRIYVKNLPLFCTDELLARFFSSFGGISKAYCVQKKSKKTKKFGYVLFEEEEAIDAIPSEELTFFNGQTVKWKRAFKTKDEASEAGKKALKVQKEQGGSRRVFHQSYHVYPEPEQLVDYKRFQAAPQGAGNAMYTEKGYESRPVSIQEGSFRSFEKKNYGGVAESYQRDLSDVYSRARLPESIENFEGNQMRPDMPGYGSWPMLWAEGDYGHGSSSSSSLSSGKEIQSPPHHPGHFEGQQTPSLVKLAGAREERGQRGNRIEDVAPGAQLKQAGALMSALDFQKQQDQHSLRMSDETSYAHGYSDVKRSKAHQAQVRGSENPHYPQRPFEGHSPVHHQKPQPPAPQDYQHYETPIPHRRPPFEHRLHQETYNQPQTSLYPHRRTQPARHSDYNQTNQQAPHTNLHHHQQPLNHNQTLINQPNRLNARNRRYRAIEQQNGGIRHNVPIGRQARAAHVNTREPYYESELIWDDGEAGEEFKPTKAVWHKFSQNEYKRHFRRSGGSHNYRFNTSSLEGEQTC